MKFSAQTVIVLAVPGAAFNGGYNLSRMGVGSVVRKGSSLLPISGGVSRAAQRGLTSYLDNIGGAGGEETPAGINAWSEAAAAGANEQLPLIPSEAVLLEVNKLNAQIMGCHATTLEIMKEIDSTFKALVAAKTTTPEAAVGHYYHDSTPDEETIEPAAYVRPPRVEETTELVDALEASAGPAPENYAPTKSTVGQKSVGTGIGSYLDGF